MKNTIKNLSDLNELPTPQATCIKGGLTDTRGTVKGSTYGATVIKK